MKLKGFLAGLAGGAIAAAAVVLLLVFVFDLGEANTTVVKATPETPTVYSTPSTTASIAAVRSVARRPEPDSASPSLASSPR